MEGGNAIDGQMASSIGVQLTLVGDMKPFIQTGLHWQEESLEGYKNCRNCMHASIFWQVV